MYPSMSSGVTLDAPSRMKPAHTSSDTGVHIRSPCAPYSACDRILLRARAHVYVYGGGRLGGQNHTRADAGFASLLFSSSRPMPSPMCASSSLLHGGGASARCKQGAKG